MNQPKRLVKLRRPRKSRRLHLIQTRPNRVTAVALVILIRKLRITVLQGTRLVPIPTPVLKILIQMIAVLAMAVLVVMAALAMVVLAVMAVLAVLAVVVLGVMVVVAVMAVVVLAAMAVVEAVKEVVVEAGMGAPVARVK